MDAYGNKDNLADWCEHEKWGVREVPSEPYIDGNGAKRVTIFRKCWHCGHTISARSQAIEITWTPFGPVVP